MIRLSISVLFLIYSAGCLIAQDLLADLKVVSERYSSTTSYVFEWDFYTLEDPQQTEHYIMKKCYNHFLLKGGNQTTCSDGLHQLTLDDASGMAYFGPIENSVELTDPMTRIFQILDHTYSESFISEVFGIKKYQIKLYETSDEHIEIWFDSNHGTINKVIQYFDSGLDQGQVFELNYFKPYCEGGNEMNINHYIMVNAHQVPTLTSEFANYNLYTDNE